MASYCFVLFLLALRLVDDVTRLAPLTPMTPSYTRVDVWIKSSVCTKISGAILAICETRNKLLPIEDHSIADDRGHTLFANLYTLLTDSQVSKLILTQFNLLLNGIAISILSLTLWNLGMRPAAILVLLPALHRGLGWMSSGPDVVAAFWGASCLGLSASLIIARIFSSYSTISTWRRLIYTSIALLLFALVGLLREPIALVSFLAVGIFSFTFLVLKCRSLKVFVISFCTLIACYFFAKKTTEGILMFRNSYWTVAPAAAISTHGIAHNLLIGLGIFENNWGLKWDDAVGMQVARRSNPEVIYCSPEYFRILMTEYLSIVRTQPIEVAKIYLRKLTMAAVTLFKASYYAWIGGVLALVILTFTLANRRRYRYENWDAISLLLITFLGHLAQGVLAFPAFPYLISAHETWLVLCFVLLTSLSKRTPP